MLGFSLPDDHRGEPMETTGARTTSTYIYHMLTGLGAALLLAAVIAEPDRKSVV